MRRVGVAIASCALLMSFACSSNSSSSGGSSPGGDLTGVAWVLDDASMMTLVDSVPNDARIDIAFDGTQVHGRSACNTYGGSYEANSDEGTLTISQLAGTQMACGNLMDLESAYLAALGDVTGYQVTGDQTGLLLTGGTAALTFVPEAPMQPLPLEGTAWTLTTIATPDTQAVSSTIAGTKVTALFDTGSVSGSGGCNGYNGAYESDGSSLTFGGMASTQRLCEQDVSDQEQVYFAALDATASYAIEGDQLTLSDAGGQMLLQFSGRAIR